MNASAKPPVRLDPTRSPRVPTAVIAMDMSVSRAMALPGVRLSAPVP